MIEQGNMAGEEKNAREQMEEIIKGLVNYRVELWDKIRTLNNYIDVVERNQSEMHDEIGAVERNQSEMYDETLRIEREAYMKSDQMFYKYLPENVKSEIDKRVEQFKAQSSLGIGI